MACTGADFELPFVVWRNVLRYIADPRDWARVEGVCKAFRDEIQRSHWARVHSLMIERTVANWFWITVKKAKSSAKGGQLVIGHQLVVGVFDGNGAVGAVQAVARRASNLKELHMDIGYLEDRRESECISMMIGSFRFSATSTLSTLTCNFGHYWHAQYFQFTQITELVCRFSTTLTEIRFQIASKSVALCLAVGKCTA